MSVGVSVPKKESREKVTGTAMYNGDLRVPGLLYARMVNSSLAHARIKSIDIDEALAAQGVKAVLIGKDHPVLTGSVLADRPPMAIDKVRYFGEPVALVVADTESHARFGCSKVKVNYEPLPIIGSISDALKSDAALVHENLAVYDRVTPEVHPKHGTNVVDHWRIRKGNILQAMRECDVVVETDCSLPHSAHAAMETRNSRAEIKPDGTVLVDTSSQSPFAVKKAISSFFHIDIGKVVVRTPLVGGAFGGKAGPQLELLAYIASSAVGGRPVDIAASREEDLISMPSHIGMESRVKMGATRDGTIQALEMMLVVNTGAYSDTGPRMAKSVAIDCTGPYRIPNVWCDSLCVYTNQPYSTSYRGFGHLEVTFAVERALEKLAYALGMDPLELRLKNAIAAGDTGPTMVRFTSSNLGSLAPCIQKLKQHLNWAEGIRIANGGTVRAKGIGCFWKTSNSPTDATSGCLLTFNPDGSLNVNFGATEIGPGTKTTVAQIVADKLKMDVNRVFVFMGVDTRVTPKHWKTVASMTTFMAGNAALEAVRDVTEQLKAVGAVVLRCGAEDLEVAGERVFLKDDPSVGVNFHSLIQGYKFANGNAIGGQIMGHGTYTMRHLTAIDPETGQGQPGPSWTVGAQGVELEFDTLTNKYKILRAVTVVDPGTVINPGAAASVLRGGMSMGIGLATREELLFGAQADILNTSLRTYKLIHIGEQPEYVVEFSETPQADGPCGARGLGEHGILAIPAAVANALSCAAQVEINQLPASPESIWNLRKGREQ